jgi:signal transduction histidine kinase
VVLDAKGSILAADDAFARLAGMASGSSLLGKAFFEEFGAVEAVRERGRVFLASPASVEPEFVAQLFGPAGGDFRIQMRSFEGGAGLCALLVVEGITEMERLRATASDYDRALPIVSRSRHEINNSLMGIVGHLEILLAQGETPDTLRRRLEILVRETDKIRDRVADLETIRRI